MRLRRRKDESVTRPTTGREPDQEELAERSVSMTAVSRDTHSAGVSGASSWMRFEFIVRIEQSNRISGVADHNFCS